jgi:hypothetical protein
VAEEVTTYKSEESSQDDSADGKQQKAEEFQSGELCPLTVPPIEV